MSERANIDHWNESRIRPSRSGKPDEPSGRTSGWEWAVAVLGLLIVIGMIGYILYYGFTTDGDTPAAMIEPVGIEKTTGGFVVKFRVRNTASATAATVRIRGELRDGSNVVETQRAQLDYLPAFSVRKGGLIFQRDPSRYALSLTPESYVDP